jgi:hemophore-related protein
MLLRTKLVGVAVGLAVSLGPVGTGTGIASAQPDVSAIVNSTCTYPQVMAALNDQNPGVANELSANPVATGWLQSLVAAPPPQRATMVQQVQGVAGLQAYMPVIFQVAGSCNRY